jgi:hypothetical protein
VLDADMHALWWPDAINKQAATSAISPDDATIYLGAGQSITTMRYADKQMLERIPVPIAVDQLFVGPSGAWVLAFQSTNGPRVTRVDLR